VITWAFGLAGSAWCILCVYYLVELLLRVHMSYTHAQKGREACTSFLLVSCLLDIMAELSYSSGVAWHRQRQRGKEREDHRESGKSKGTLMGYSPRRIMTVEPSSCARPYTVYARQMKQEQASEWRAERAATGEQPGVPFYRLGRGLCHQLVFSVLSHATMVLTGRWTVVGGAARSRGRRILGMHGRCLTLHGGRHKCEYTCVHATKALLVLHACMSYLYVWVHC
jgi:hypothetical protein